MAADDRCRECGNPVAAAGGICSPCLLKRGLEHPTGSKDDSSGTTKADDTTPTGPDERIGPYRVLQKLGEGGMGEVWLAEQEEPVRRKVALKLIKMGMDTKRVIARFESERQALALMNHPNIARVFDAGSTDKGRPYFAMEYVKGEPITQYCDRHRLSTGERLELLLTVCEGVQHAHQKGIIHRDIKPSNVLVAVQDDHTVPKIIDFGVAKATEHRSTEKTMFTQLGALIGTPEYMSPEQAEMTGLDVDTRTDVYSLGVMLYELLVGALPFDPKQLRAASFDEIRRKIREDEPSRPSTRLSTLGERSRKSASMRRSDPASLARQLRGDLDWITMKALLAADIGRHLRHEPVIASPPSTTYRMRKFVRRHRIGVAASGFVLAALVLGLSGTTYGLIRATRAESEARLAESEAREAAATAEYVSEFLTSLFQVSNPSEARGNAITAREILDVGASKIRAELADQPEVQTRLMGTMGSVYKNLGLVEQANSLLVEALEQGRRVLEDDPSTIALILTELGDSQRMAGRYEEAESSALEALEIRRLALGEKHADTLRSISNLGLIRIEQGRYAEAEPLFVELLALHRQVRGVDDNEIRLTTMHNLALVYRNRGRYEEAEPLWSEVLEARRRILGDDHPNTTATMGNLGMLYHDLRRYEEAERLMLETLANKRRVQGEDHPDVWVSMNNLALLYSDMSRYDEAERLYGEVLEFVQSTYGEAHPGTIVSMGNLGDLYTTMGRYEEAERLLGTAMRNVENLFPRIHVVTGFTIRKLGRCLSGMRRFEEAETKLLEAHEIQTQAVGAGHDQTKKVVKNLVELYDAWGRPEKARRWREALPQTENGEAN
jgi:non-specific serine/threonine protein kinase/serine/threonine-protein kinase